ncbi:MAG: hypothetical protein NXI24_17750 [bacterium]|nr:hypothetical protein [bacterium]
MISRVHSKIVSVWSGLSVLHGLRRVALNLCVFAVCWFMVVPGSGLWSQAGEELPGDPARVAYEMGFSYLLADDAQQARTYLEEAVAAGGNYGDLARVELVRLLAYASGPTNAAPATAGTDGDAVLASIRAILLGFEDRTRIPRAWFAAVQALEEAGQYAPALRMAMELALRYPASAETDDALLTAARLHAANGHPAAALESLFRILKDHAAGDRMPTAVVMIANIYSAPGEYYSPARACAALESLRMRPGPRTSAHAAALGLYRDFCVY